MKRFWGCLLLGGWLLSGSAAAEKVRVAGQRVNLRARADIKAEVVGQVEDGEVLEVRATRDDWLEVVPPENMDLWVHKDFVQGGVTIANKLQVRAGPGINYSVVGTLDKGQAVAPRGDFGEWLKIAPPPGASLWVARSYVEPLSAAKPKPLPPAAPTVAAAPKPAAETPAPAPRPASPPPSAPGPMPFPRPPTPSAGPPAPIAVTTQRVVSVQTVKPPEPAPPPPGLNLIPLEGQGRTVQREGILKYSGHLLNRPSRYRLVSPAGAQIETLCYVHGNEAQMREFLGRHLLIRGREYWVRGVRIAVLVPDQIIPRAQP